jgi:hypothetical protein
MSSVVTPAAVSSATGVAGAAFAQSSEYEEGTPYKASGRVEPAGVPMLFFGSLVVGLLTGALYCVISNFLDLLIVFPIAFGLLGGALLGGIVKVGKIRSSKLAGACGLLAGLLIFGVVEVGHAYMQREEMVNAMTDYSVEQVQASNMDQNGKPIPIPDTELATLRTQAHDSWEKTMTPYRTVRLYEVLSAESGMTVKHNGVGTGVKFSGMAFWVMHGIELVCTALACMVVAAGTAKDPFCERCGQWQNSTSVLKVHPIQNKQLLEKVDARDWKGLIQTPAGGTMDNKTQTTVNVTKCPTCGCGTIGITSTQTVPQKYSHINIGPDSVLTLMTPPPAQTA